MDEYNNLLRSIVNSIINCDKKDINLTNELKNILDINLYTLLININKKEFKYEMDKEEEKELLEFIRLLNNFKVQIELNRRHDHLEESASKVLDSFYRNENILLNYLDDNVRVEDMLLVTDIKEIDNLIIDLSCKKKDKDKVYESKNKKIKEYTKLLNNKEYNVILDKIIFNDEEVSIDEFKNLFNYLLNIDNYEFDYKSSKIKNLQLNIVKDIIDNINTLELDINKISKVIIPLLLNTSNNINESVDSSGFKIDNISINDLLKNKNNELKENLAKVSFKGNNIALSNEYLFNKIIKIFNLGKYYFSEDKFILDDKDFKCSILISKMVDYLISLS